MPFAGEKGWQTRVVQMKHEPSVIIKDLEDVKAFVKLNLAKEEYFKKLWKKALKTA